MGILRADDYRLISELEFFRGVSVSEIERLFAGAVVKKLKHREFLYHAGTFAESFCIVLEGALKLIKSTPRGEDMIVHFATPGDLVGALMMNHESQSIYPVSAKSMGPVRVVCLSKETFQKHWKNNLLIQGRLNSLLYQRMVLIQDDKALFSSPLKVRVANLLLRHLDQSEVQSPQTPSIILTRQEIADSLGVAVESVIRLMRDWISDGTIERDEELRLETINVPKLLEHAQS